MASLAASDASPVVIHATAVGVAPCPEVVDATSGAPALPARSATIVRIAGLAVLCAATVVAPAWLLVWMPIVLGVPHVVSDVRYLVLPLPRRQVMVALAACATLVALEAVSITSGVPLLRVEIVVVAVWLLAALALDRSTRRSHVLTRHAHGLARHAQIAGSVSPRGAMTSWVRRATTTWVRRATTTWVRRATTTRRGQAMWIAAVFVAVVIIALPIQFAILAAFAHNFVAIVAWAVLRRPARSQLLAVTAALATAIAIIVAT